MASFHQNTSKCYPPFLLFPLESSFLGKSLLSSASPLASSPCPLETRIFPEATSLTAPVPHTKSCPEVLLESSSLFPLPHTPPPLLKDVIHQLFRHSPHKLWCFPRLWHWLSYHIFSSYPFHDFNFPYELMTPNSVPPTQMSPQHSRSILSTTPGTWLPGYCTVAFRVQPLSLPPPKHAYLEHQWLSHPTSLLPHLFSDQVLLIFAPGINNNLFHCSPISLLTSGAIIHSLIHGATIPYFALRFPDFGLPSRGSRVMPLKHNTDHVTPLDNILFLKDRK